MRIIPECIAGDRAYLHMPACSSRVRPPPSRPAVLVTPPDPPISIPQDQRGAPVLLGLNYRGISVLQDGRRTHLFRWNDVQKLNFENKMFIVHLVFVEDSRNKVRGQWGGVSRCSVVSV